MAIKTQSLFDNQLGYLAIYSLEGSCEVNTDELSLLAKRAGVDEAYLPPPIREVDAFRRATAGIADRRHVDGAEPILVREIPNDKDKIVRILEKRMAIGDQIALIENQGQAKLKYAHIGTIVLHRHTGAVETVCLSECARAPLAEAEQAYRKLVSTYTIDHIRKMVQNAFFRCNGINYRRNGGVSFIPRKYADSIERMSKLVSSLPGGGCVLDLIEVIDSPERRDDIAQKLLYNVSEAVRAEAKVLGGSVDVVNSRQTLDDLVAEYAIILTDKKVSQARAKEAVARFAELGDTIRAYEELLGANLEETRNQITLAKTQLRAILNKESGD